MKTFFAQDNTDFDRGGRGVLGRFFPMSYKTAVFLCVALIGLLTALSYVVIGWGSAAGPGSMAQTRVFTIAPGDGFKAIVGRLAAEHLIRSETSFELLSLLTGSAGKFKPGAYELSPAMTSVKILGELVAGPREVEVTIPEGASVYAIDRLLADAKVIRSGSLVALNASSSVEGTLFPDTYKFLTNSAVSEIVSKLRENFSAKMASALLDIRTSKGRADLILASIVEKEVPGTEDREIVAGILKKRLNVGMALNVDATICYAKEMKNFPELHSCYPLSPADFKIDSAYNTYSRKGLPPGAIGNPGLEAVAAVLNAKSSPYWFYLSDPKTQRTIYAKTLDEQSANKRKYLSGN